MIKKQILGKINEYKRFLITAHINPEGDSICSQLAMANLLTAMGKDVKIVNADSVPKNLLFLPMVEKIKSIDDKQAEEFEFDAVIILDCPNLERIGSVQSILKEEYIICIDHHVSNDNFGDLNWTDSKASSAGEMVYDLFKTADISLDESSAMYLYTAIMTDTGSFRYTNTTMKTHNIAADLLNYNFSPTKVYELIYETKSFEVMKLLSEVLSNLQRSQDGRLVWFKVTNEMLEKNNLSSDSTEDFIAFVRMVEGAEVVVFLREINKGSKVKISMRSKTDIDVNLIAGHFGGGGHKAASGCIINGNIEQAEKMLLAQIKIAFEDRDRYRQGE